METGIGKRIKSRRLELGLTQEELANRLGLRSKSTICKVERGEDNLTSPIVKKYAKALEVSPAYLMGWQDAVDEEFEVVFKQDDFIPPEVWTDAELRDQLKEFIPLFVNASGTDRDTYLRILKGLQSKP